MPGVPPPAPRRVEGPPPTSLSTRLGTAAGAILLIVAATLWYDDTRQIAQLSREVATIKETQQQLGAAIAKLQPGRGNPAEAPAARSVGQTINVIGAPAKGGDQAMVTLIEFSDYECPFCVRHFTQTMPQIEAAYIATGKIRYVFRDLPIDELHPQSIQAHVAARCAGDQHKFWDLHVKLFSKAGTHQPADLEARAREAGLDLNAFRSCVASNRYPAIVHGAVADLARLTDPSTPTFFLGVRDLKTQDVKITKQISGAVPFGDFQAAIDEAIRHVGAK